MILIHFCSTAQVEALRPFLSIQAYGLMLAHSMLPRDLQLLRQQQEQKRLDHIAATIFPPGTFEA